MSKIRDKKRHKDLEKKRAARANKEVLPSFKYLLTIAYDGSSFGGYAKQKHGNTIQNKLEQALQELYGVFISTTESSRTDAKVHALDQKVTYETNIHLNMKKINNYLQNKLNDSIIIKDIEIVKNDFHCRYDVKDKTYEYTICKEQDPRHANYSLYMFDKLDVKLMEQASKALIGKHDFIAYRSAKATSTTTVRTINYIEFSEDDKFITIRFNADGFLYNMIRRIMYCLIQVGLNKQDVDYLKDVLSLQYENGELESVKANGLCLTKINY